MASEECLQAWALTLEQASATKSSYNRMRKRRILRNFRVYCNNEQPQIQHYFEFVYKLVKVDGLTPHKVIRNVQDIGAFSPIMDNMPRMTIVCCKYNILLSPEQVKQAIDMMPTVALKAFAAISSSGIKFQRRYMRMKMSDYDRERHIVLPSHKLPPWLAEYVNAQYDYALDFGRQPNESLFFYKKPRRGDIVELEYAKYRHASRKIKVETGMNLIAHNYLNYQTFDLDPKLPVTIVGGTYGG